MLEKTFIRPVDARVRKGHLRTTEGNPPGRRDLIFEYLVAYHIIRCKYVVAIAYSMTSWKLISIILILYAIHAN